MKAKHILGLFLLLCSVSGFAQRGEHHRKDLSAEEIAQKRTKKMAQQLQLTDEQTESVYEINLKAAQEKKEQEQKIKALKEAYVNDLKSVLTDEQIVKLESAKNKRKMKHKEKMSKRKEKALEEENEN